MNIGNVTDMSMMFCNAILFNQSLGSWDVQNVKHTNNMFYKATSFNQTLHSWKLSAKAFMIESLKSHIYFMQIKKWFSVN